MIEATKTTAYWHQTFVEVKNPHKENEAVRFYFDPPQLERNFCPRCGKRTPDLTHIHTCTPPQD